MEFTLESRGLVYKEVLEVPFESESEVQDIPQEEEMGTKEKREIKIICEQRKFPEKGKMKTATDVFLFSLFFFLSRIQMAGERSSRPSSAECRLIPGYQMDTERGEGVSSVCLLFHHFPNPSIVK